MAVDTPQVQRRITLWALIASTLVGGITYICGIKQFAYGLGFGVILCVINYRVISVILDVAFRFTSPGLARVISFVSYHVRFWLIVIILYIVIPKTHYLFGVGTFAGILIPKIVMGVFVVLHTDDEWWNQKVDSSMPHDEAVVRKKDEPEGLRFPGLDFDERFHEEPLAGDTDENLKL